MATKTIMENMDDKKLSATSSVIAEGKKLLCVVSQSLRNNAYLICLMLCDKMLR